MLELGEQNIFISRIVPLVYIILTNFNFTRTRYIEGLTYKYFFLLLIFFLLLVFCVKRSFFFLTAVECTVFLMWFIVINFSKDKDKIQASTFLVLINIRGSFPFIAFFFVRELNYHFSRMFWFFDDLILCFIIILMFLCKIPIFFFHLWLLKAHVRASGRCSMILASLLLKIGTFGILKFSPRTLIRAFRLINPSLAVGIRGCLTFLFCMLRFFDIKYIIACSSVLHMGFIIPLRLSQNPNRVCSVIMIMVGHGLVSLILFYLVTLIYEGCIRRNLDLNKCMHSSRKFFLITIFIYFFINMGVPPFINFYREVLFFNFFFSFSHFTSIGFLFICLLSIFFTFFIISSLIFGKKISLVNQEVSPIIWSQTMCFLVFIFFSLFLS